MAKKVVIYTTPTCAYCQMAKEYFKDNNIEYEEIDVAADQTVAQKMMEKTGQMGVPQIFITTEDGKEEVIIGFDEAKLEELLK